MVPGLLYVDAVRPIYPAEFHVQIADYLEDPLGPKYPKTLEQLIERSQEYTFESGARRRRREPAPLWQFAS